MLPPAKHPHPKWLADAIFYEIYPQSFVDSNGDGIGDIPGITARNTSGSTAVARSNETIIPTATSGQTHGSPVATDCHSSAANRPATVPTS